ncbi:MAG: hypothetical protein AAGA56_04680 [Myxococcota bacterium]
MSIVVAVRKGPRIVMGCDSRVGWTGELIATSTTKMFRGPHGSVVGICGDWRPGHLASRIVHGLAGADLDLSSEVADALSIALTQKLGTEAEVELILAVGHSIYMYDSTLVPIKIADDYAAIGSGRPVAIGAMHATYDHHEDPAEVATHGLAAAVAFCPAWCGPPLHFEEIGL